MGLNEPVNTAVIHQVAQLDTRNPPTLSHHIDLAMLTVSDWTVCFVLGLKLQYLLAGLKSNIDRKQVSDL